MNNLKGYIHLIRYNWLLIFTLIIVTLIGIGVRLAFLEQHFTHIDDIGVARTILERREELRNLDARYENELRPEVLSGKKGSNLQKIAKILDEAALLKPIVYLASWWRKFLHPVPRNWTYAPGQFYLTNLLVKPGQDYSEIKFWGRFPSFVFNVTSWVLLSAFFIRLYRGSDGLLPALVSVTMLAYSWENIIYSAQMESYAVGNFSAMILFLYLLHMLDHPIRSNKHAFLAGTILAIPGLFQYQALVLVLPLYGTLAWVFFGSISKHKLVHQTFFTSLGFLSVFLIFIWPYLKKKTNSGITWNAGPNNEFVLDPIWANGFAQGLVEIAEFFYKNLPLVIEAMLSPVSHYSQSHVFLGWLLVALCLIGVASMMQSSNLRKRAIAVFCLLSGVTWIVLLLGKIWPLSPTRHSLVLCAFAVILITEGLCTLNNRMKAHFFRGSIGGLPVLISPILIAWSVMFITTIDTAFAERIDPFNEKEISASLRHEKVDFIVNFDSSTQLYLMPSIISKYPMLDVNIWKDKVDNISNYGKNDSELTNNKELSFAVYSGLTCLNLDDQNINLALNAILKRYGFNPEFTTVKIKRQACKGSEVEIEWSPRTENGRNGFNSTLLEITRVDHENGYLR